MAKHFDAVLENPNGLSMEMIASKFPTVVAEEASKDRSKRYLHIPTHALILRLLQEGLVPVTVMQANARTESNEGHTRHLLRLRQVRDLGMSTPISREIVLLNNSNGTGAYEFLAGVFRMVCRNGLISGDINERLKIRHVGRPDLLELIIHNTWEAARNSTRVIEVADIMRGIQLTQAERLAFADMAMSARFGLPETDPARIVEADEEGIDPRVAFHPSQFLEARRTEDRSPDLFTTLNVAQEHLIRGGAQPRVRGVRRLRPVQNIPDTVKINQMVWGFAEQVALYKQSGVLPDRQS
jgi:Domain of unknown function (DUF932)